MMCFVSVGIAIMFVCRVIGLLAVFVVLMTVCVRLLLRVFNHCFSICCCLSFVLFLLRVERVARGEHVLERLINRKMGFICVF